MKLWNQAELAWANTRELPTILRMLIRGGMIATPMLLVVMVLPTGPWMVDGKAKTYAGMWRSGGAELAVLWLLLIAAGCWGVALRKPGARWLLVLTPLASLVVGGALMPIHLSDVLSTIVGAVIVYIGLFRMRFAQSYFGTRS